MDCNSEVCRTCLSFNVKLNSIFEDNVASILGICNFLEVIADDCLPKQICESCKSFTLKSYRFKQKCKASELKLRERFMNQSESEDVKGLLAGSNSTYESKDVYTENSFYERDVFVCPFCLTKYSDSTNLKKHLQETKGECNQKNTCTKSESEVKIDVSEEFLTPIVKSEPAEFVCKECNETCNSESDLILHCSIHSSKISNLPINTSAKNGDYRFAIAASDISEIKIDVSEEFFTPYVKNEPPQFVCEECNQNYDSESDLQLHYSTHSTESLTNNLEESNDKWVDDKRLLDDFYAISCKENNSDSEPENEFNTKGTKSTASKRDVPFKCMECKEIFSLEHDLKIHQYIHEDISDSTCPICKKQFSKRYLLKPHLKTHMIHKPHACSVCNKSFARSVELKKHFRQIHEGVKRENKHFCQHCDKGFSCSYGLKVHMRNHTGEKPFKCNICEKTFISPYILKIHSLVHSDERAFKCDVCNKTFNRKYNLDKHAKIHTGEKPFICSDCGKCFTTAATLHGHMKSHSDNRPHICKLCSRGFKTKNSLELHIKTHTGEKPYECEQCGKGFPDRTRLKFHINFKHLDIKKFICSFCNKGFSHQSKLLAHMRIHTGERPFVCEYCNRDFADKGNWKKHMSRVHENVNENLKNESKE